MKGLSQSPVRDAQGWRMVSEDFFLGGGGVVVPQHLDAPATLPETNSERT